MGSKLSSTGAAAKTMSSKAAQASSNADTNIALVIGALVAEPETRTLPSGSVAASFSVTVRTLGEKTTSVPMVWYDPPKRLFRWTPGEQVITHGSVVRRFFRSTGGLGSATEVVVQSAELMRHETKGARLMARIAVLFQRIVVGH